MIAINIGLKISIDLYTFFRRKKNKLCTSELYTTGKCLAEGYLCMLLPVHTVSSGSAFCLVQ